MACEQGKRLHNTDHFDEKQKRVFLDLCKSFLSDLEKAPSGEFECFADLVDRLVRSKFQRANIAKITGYLDADQLRQVQARFAETAYASFNLAPPSCDRDKVGDNPVEVRCLFCDEVHLLPQHDTWPKK